MVGAIACGRSYAEAAATAGWPSRCACIAAVRQSPTREARPEAKAQSAVANFQVRRRGSDFRWPHGTFNQHEGLTMTLTDGVDAPMDGPQSSSPPTANADGGDDTCSSRPPTAATDGVDDDTAPAGNDQVGSDSTTGSSRKARSNRMNARKSTGPPTPAGKHRSAQNVTKHGASHEVENAVTSGIYRVTSNMRKKSLSRLSTRSSPVVKSSVSSHSGSQSSS